MHEIYRQCLNLRMTNTLQYAITLQYVFCIELFLLDKSDCMTFFMTCFSRHMNDACFDDTVCHTCCPPCRLIVLPMFQKRWL